MCLAPSDKRSLSILFMIWRTLYKAPICLLHKILSFPFARIDFGLKRKFSFSFLLMMLWKTLYMVPICIFQNFIISIGIIDFGLKEQFSFSF